MTHPTEAAKAAKEVHDSCPGYLTSEMERHWMPELTAIIQASNEAYAAAKTRELVEALEAARVFTTPLERLKNWNEFKEDAARRINALLATHQPTKEV